MSLIYVNFLKKLPKDWNNKTFYLLEGISEESQVSLMDIFLTRTFCYTIILMGKRSNRLGKRDQDQNG